MDSETPTANETPLASTRHSRRRFLGVMAGAVTGVGVGAAATRFGALPGAASPVMETRGHPMADWSETDIYRVQSARLVNGKPELMDPITYGARGHDPLERGDPERHRLLALLGALKRAWEYPAVMQAFERDPGGFLKDTEPFNGTTLGEKDIIRLLRLPAATDVAKLDRKELASALKLKAPQDETPHVVFTLLSVLHSHPLIAAECK